MAEKFALVGATLIDGTGKEPLENRLSLSKGLESLVWERKRLCRGITNN